MKRLDRHGCDITGLVGLYDDDTDTIIDLGCYVCLPLEPVSGWESDPWLDQYDRMVEQLRKALLWLPINWLVDVIWEYLDEETADALIEHGLEGPLREAIDRMIDANEPWPTERATD